MLETLLSTISTISTILTIMIIAVVAIYIISLPLLWRAIKKHEYFGLEICLFWRFYFVSIYTPSPTDKSAVYEFGFRYKTPTV